jgi:hypothetical protein
MYAIRPTSVIELIALLRWFHACRAAVKCTSGNMNGVVAAHHGGRVEMKRYRSVAVCYDKRARWGPVDHQIARLDGYRVN